MDNTNKDLVSVIITTYKGSKSIRTAVMSVLNQTYKNIEIIVVDDNGAGTEEQKKTETILQYFINNYNIVYFKHEINSNGSVARNTGAKNASGKWLAFLDDDDIYLSEKIAKELELIKSMNVDMTVCGGYYINKKGIGYKSEISNSSDLLVNYLTEKVLFNTSTILIRKDVFFDVHGFDESFKRHQDWEFCTRIISSYQVGIVSTPLIAKYSFNRNIASNGQVAENYLNHFFDERGKILSKLEDSQRVRIFDYQYSRIAKVYLQENDWRSCFKILKKTSNGKLQILTLIGSYRKHFLKKVKYGSKKCFISYEECTEWLQNQVGGV